jgi:hypothetical protein
MLKKLLLKIVLISVALAATACGKLPPAPEIWQCAHISSSTAPSYFLCVNSRSGEEKRLENQAEVMYGAQCMSLGDFKSMSAWVEQIKLMAEKRCK